MGIGRWLRGATRIRFDDRTAANVLRTGGMLGGAALGGPAGLALAAAGGAAGRGISKGANFGNIVGAGVKGAAAAGGLRAGAGLLNSARGALSGAGAGGSGSAASGGAGGALDALPTELPSVGLTPGAAPAITAAAPAVAGAPSAAPGMFRSALNTAGSFVKDNPTAVGMGLQGVGNLATAGTENRMNDAQARILEQRADETEFDFMQRKQRDAALAPLWSQLGSTFNTNNNAVARNPWTVNQ